MRVLLIGVFLIATACTTTPKKEASQEEPLKIKNAEELITVATAIQLARSSYLLGCVEASKKLKAPKGYSIRCRDQAKKSVEENVISIIGR